MKVRLLKEETIKQYAQGHANGRVLFDKFLFAIKYADWDQPLDMSSTFQCNLLGGSNRVIFDVGGNSTNSYRIICEYYFGKTMVHLYVNWIGTHEDYNQLTSEQKKAINIY